jgi:hypothetical protein
MKKQQKRLVPLIATPLALLVLPAHELGANSLSGGWGVASAYGSDGAAQSNALHQGEREVAQLIEFGRYAANNFSGTACGTCIYYTIQGNSNTISGNTSLLENSGDVQSITEFSFD